MSAAAQAGTLNDTLVPGVINTYEDQSRESVVDLDGSRTLSNGDILFGFISLDNRSVPAPGTALPVDGVSIVFSQMIANYTVIVDIPGVAYLATWDLVPTPLGHPTRLDIGSLYADATGGGALPALTSPGLPMALALSDLGFDPLTTHPGDIAGVGNVGSVDLVDLVQHMIAGGSLDLVAGIGTDVGDDDFFSGAMSLLGAATALNPNKALPLLDTLGLATPVGATFNGGLSALYDSLAKTLVQEGMPFPNIIPPYPPGVTFHDTTITAGNVGGAADILYPGVVGTRIAGNPFAFIHTVGGVFTAYGSSDNADVSMLPSSQIPEPVTAVLGLMGLAGLSLVTRRRRA